MQSKDCATIVKISENKKRTHEKHVSMYAFVHVSCANTNMLLHPLLFIGLESRWPTLALATCLKIFIDLFITYSTSPDTSKNVPLVKQDYLRACCLIQWDVYFEH